MSNDVLIQAQFWLSPVVSSNLFHKNSYDEKDEYQGHHKSDENCFKFIFVFYIYKIARQENENYYLNKGGR